jgi:hypothetical protein
MLPMGRRSSLLEPVVGCEEWFTEGISGAELTLASISVRFITAGNRQSISLRV